MGKKKKKQKYTVPNPDPFQGILGEIDGRLPSAVSLREQQLAEAFSKIDPKQQLRDMVLHHSSFHFTSDTPPYHFIRQQNPFQNPIPRLPTIPSTEDVKSLSDEEWDILKRHREFPGLPASVVGTVMGTLSREVRKMSTRQKRHLATLVENKDKSVTPFGRAAYHLCLSKELYTIFDSVGGG